MVYKDAHVIGLPIGIFSTKKDAIIYKKAFRKDQKRGLKVYPYKLNPDYDLDNHGPYKYKIVMRDTMGDTKYSPIY